MTRPETDQPGETERVGEERILRLGYFAMFAERFPLNDDFRNCLTPESAYFFELEQEHMRIPNELTFDALQNDIPPTHRARIKRIWKKVLESRKEWEGMAEALQEKWEQAPADIQDANAQLAVSQSAITIQEDMRKAVSAVISIPPKRPDRAHLSTIERWQMDEKGLRDQLYKADKNFITVLRLYYEMLLERPKKEEPQAKDPSMWPLAPNHPKRMEIVVRNRYLRVIDATHQGISIAKGAHHEQPKKRVRKTEAVPYIYHPQAATGMFLQDVLPYTIDGEKSQLHFILLGIFSAALHDLGEDTDLTVDDIVEFLRTRADKYDSSFDQVIEGGFGQTRSEIKKARLNLIRDYILRELRPLLRILSKNTELTDEERERIFKDNIAGAGKTLQYLGVDPQSDESIPKKFLRLITGSRSLREKPSSETFRRFPESHEPKTDAFLMRLYSLSSRETQQCALLVKLEERTHNILKLDGRSPEDQQRTLRSTVTRLIAWAMLGHDCEKFPLYNALPRAIDETMRRYIQFAGEHKDLMEPCDHEYMKQLGKWALDAKRWPVSDSMKNILAEWQMAHMEPHP